MGNLGDKVKLEASGIDTAAPSLTIKWTPPYITAGGETDTERYPSEPVNTSVYAHIAADKPIDVEKVKLTHYTLNGRDWIELASGNIDDIPNCNANYTVNAEGITVCFVWGGIGLRFDVPSPNGRSAKADVYLLTEVIDKTAPTVQTEIDELIRDEFSIPYAVKVKITPDKSVYCLNYGTAGKVYDGTTPLELTVTENGAFEYIFVDTAGNLCRRAGNSQ